MESKARVLVAAASEADLVRARDLLARSCLCGELGTTSFARLADEGGPVGWDALVLAFPVATDSHLALLERLEEHSPALPVLLLTHEFTGALAAVAHRFDARVCLFQHGPDPLDHALARAVRVHNARRQTPGDTAKPPDSPWLLARMSRALEDAVATSERVRALVALSVGDVLFTLKVEGEEFRFVEINPAFSRATGLSEEQVVGKRVNEVIPEPSLSLVMAKYRQAIAERRTVRWEETTDYPTGTKYGEVSVTPLVDGMGRCTALIGTVHDVTDVRQAEETVRLYADIAGAVQIGLTLWKVVDPDDTGSITLVAANPAADHAMGSALGTRIGERLLDLLPAGGGPEIIGLVCDVARDRKTRELPQWDFVEAPGCRRSFVVKAFPLSGRRVGLAIEDVTDQARARALRAAEHRALEMIASDASLDETLSAIALAMEDLAPPATASVLLLSPDGRRVLHVTAPHLPEQFKRLIGGGSSEPWVRESRARAGFLRSVTVADIEDEPCWEDYRELARSCGLRACWSTPIFASYGRMLGVFAVYGAVTRAPTPADLEVFARATHVAGIAIQRHELDDQLRQLAARIEAAREEERTGIAREIHDQLGQSLTAIKLDLAWIARRAASPAGLDVASEVLLERARTTVALTDEVIQQVRRISAELRPGVLDDLGLSAALEWQAQEFEKRTGVPCLVSSSLGDARFSRDICTAVFRIFQEALTNVARHAHATQVDVLLERGPSSLRLEVRDDGAGVAAEVLRSPKSLGLLGMRERARYVGGRAEVSAQARGTLVSLEVPLREATPREAEP